MSEIDPQIGRRALLKAGAMVALSACAPRLPAQRSPLPSGGGADPYIEDDAMSLALRVRSREVTPLELLDLVIARIEALEGTINALTTRTFERARARAATRSLDAPFAGVPFLIKDMIDCAGVRRTDGAHAVFSRTPEKSPAYIQAVEASGLNIVGVTNVPEFATLVTTVNPRFGATANPWDLSRTPAGSSGGTAAAVAAGYVPLAHGTDGAGSMRLPASYCGVFGFKPSRARTLSGEADGGHDLVKHHHGISRTVRDSAMLLSLTEDRGRSARYAPIGFVREAAAARRSIGIDRGGLFGLTPDREQTAALDSTIALLAELGHEVFVASELPISAGEFWQHLEAVFVSRMPGLIRLTESLTGKPFEQTDVLSPFTMSLAELSREQAPDARARAAAYFADLERKLVEHMAGMDVLLSPVQAIAQPPIDVYDPSSSFEAEARSIREFLSYTGIANATGAPAMSVPLYWGQAAEGWGEAAEGGLPLGSHFMAKPGADRLLMELAYELEVARPWKGRWAPHSIRNL